MKIILISGILAVFFLTACHKEKSATDAMINFVEPTVGDTLALGEELHAEGSITADGEMHGYSLSFYNVTTGQSIYSDSTDNHADTYSFHEHWVNTVTDTSTVRIRMEVTLDHDGNTKLKDIEVVCIP